MPSMRSLYCMLPALLLLCSATAAFASEEGTIVICWGRTGAIECGTARTEDAGTKYARSQCRFWANSQAERDTCREVWRCAEPGWSGVALQSKQVVASVCGAAKLRTVTDNLRERCSSCSISIFSIGGMPSDAGVDAGVEDAAPPSPSADVTTAIKMFLAATRHEGTAYGDHKDGGLVCSDLVIAAAKEVGLSVSVSLKDKSKLTNAWFARGFGNGFKQVAGGQQGFRLSELTDRVAKDDVTIPLGALIVADGHVAFYAGVATANGQQELVLYDANGTDKDLTLTIEGTLAAPEEATTSTLNFKGNSVGYHLGRHYWGAKRMVKVFVPR